MKVRVSIRIFTCKRQKLTLANKSRNRNLWTFPRAPRIIAMTRELAHVKARMLGNRNYRQNHCPEIMWVGQHWWHIYLDTHNPHLHVNLKIHSFILSGNIYLIRPAPCARQTVSSLLV